MKDLLLFLFLSSDQEKGIDIDERTQPDGKTKQVFFFDPDGESFLLYSTHPNASYRL